MILFLSIFDSLPYDILIAKLNEYDFDELPLLIMQIMQNYPIDTKEIKLIINTAVRRRCCLEFRKVLFSSILICATFFIVEEYGIAG